MAAPLAVNYHNLPLTADVFGMHFLYYPLGSTTPSSTQYGICRSHDWNGAATSSFALTKWCTVETSDGVYDWTRIDAWVAQQRSLGKKMLLTIDGTPAWAVATPGASVGIYRTLAGATIPGSNLPPDDLSKWSRWCTAVATRYGGTDVAYEIWNEPHFPGSPTVYWNSTATALATMMRLAYQAIKAAAPSAIVVSPSCDVNTVHLMQLLDASDGAGGTGVQWFDVLGFHFYQLINGLLSVENVLEQYRQIKTALVARGRSSVPIWNTETGIMSSGLQNSTDAQRRKYIRKFVFSHLAAGCEKTFFYCYDSGSMGMRLPSNTGATYDMLPHWNEAVSSLLGKTLVQSMILPTNGIATDWSVTLFFSDGTSLVS